MLNYLSKDYLRDGGNGSTIEWSVSAESFRRADAATLEQDATASAIIKSLDRYIGSWRQSMTDVNGESVDLSHMCVTTLGYLNGLVVPDTWTGWAGDLGSAMSNIQKAKDWNPQASIDVIAEALVGADDNYRQQGALQGLTLDKQVDGTGRPSAIPAIVTTCAVMAMPFTSPTRLRTVTAATLTCCPRPCAATITRRTSCLTVSSESHGAWVPVIKAAAVSAFRGVDWQQMFTRWLLTHSYDTPDSVIDAACSALAEFIF